MNRYPALDITIEDGVATIRMRPLSETFQEDPPPDVHYEMPGALEELRRDDSVRAIVITGQRDGVFLTAPESSYYTGPRSAARLAEPHAAWKVQQGVVRCFQVMTEIEKPIVAKVNGDAIGFGQSIMLGADIIVVREDARISDVHLGMGEVMPSDGDGSVGPPFGIVPGDGAGALIPLFMSPTKAKEYMMLSLTYTGAELAEMGIANRAVPAAQLDATVDELVDRLLKRSAFALAWTKRVLNRHVAQQVNLAVDAAVGYEQLNLLQIQSLGFDGDPTTLERPA